MVNTESNILCCLFREDGSDLPAIGMLFKDDVINAWLVWVILKPEGNPGEE